MSTREKNAQAKYGRMSLKPIGPLPDKEEYEAVTINAASDDALLEALARRGYDVTCKAITSEVAAKRTATYEKKQAARVRRATKASPSI